MGKFDGILLTSDWDGTLISKNTLNPRDIEAIRYFQKNGGSFTVCTGRDLPHIRMFFDDVKPNTYLIALNGAKIIHPDSLEIIYEGFLDNGVYRVLDELFVDESYFTDMNVYLEGMNDSVYFYPHEYAEYHDKMLLRRAYKILLYGDSEEKVLEAQARANALGLDGYVFVRSWKYSLELLKKKNAKGAAIRRLAEHINAKKLIAVGDFENDIQMLEAADIGYAVGDATDALKKVADRVTVPAAEGAISHIIEDIEKELK